MKPLCSQSRGSFEAVAAFLEGRPGPLLVGIGGPGGCGKSTLVRWLLERLPDAGELALDEFRLPRGQRPAHAPFGSHPDGNDLALVREAFARFRNSLPVPQPRIDPVTGQRVRLEQIQPRRILLADGEIAAHRELRPLVDVLILVEAHWRTQLNTRLTRDLNQRHCSLEKAITIFLQSNLRDYPAFAEGASSDADIRLYRNARGVFCIKSPRS